MQSSKILAPVYQGKRMSDMEKKSRIFLNKRQFLIILIILLIICAAAAIFSNKQRKISRFVMKNISELEEIALTCLNGDHSIKEYRGVKVNGVYEGEQSIVDFYYGGFGIAPSSVYYGFYYSPDDVPVETAFFMNYSGYQMTDEKTDEWVWEEVNGDNGCQVIKIIDYWYYYKAWF